MSAPSEWIDLSVDDGTSMRAWVTRPEGPLPSRGLLVFQEAFGVNGHIRDVATRFAEAGFVAIAPELFRDAAFFSIGSNDLTQYVMAAARDNGAVGALNVPTHPAVLRLIESTVNGAAALHIPVSLCGDAGSDPEAIGALLKAGLRSLSVAPAQLALAKRAISKATLA